MTLTKKRFNKLLESMWVLHITKEQYDAILERFGTEPGDGEAWTEQDIYEQIRKMID